MHLPLVTPRLTLRRFEDDDYDDLMAYSSRADVSRYLYHSPWDEPSGRSSLDRRVANPFPSSGDGMAFAVAITESGRVIGEISLTCTNETAQQAEIGWAFHLDAGGKGYATEAARTVLDASFGVLGYHRIHARLDEDNRASARLCERLGMRLEARLVENDRRVSSFEPGGVWGTELHYAILQQEWAASRTPEGKL